VAYESRHSFRQVFQQYEAFGRSKTRYWRLTGARPNARQLLAMSLGMVGTVSAGVLAVRSPGRLRQAAAGGLAALVIVDHQGAESARSSERAVSCVTYAMVYAGWLTGLTSEWLKGK
jgi:hypothetical protein